jgi:antirestriction protein ArdC
MSTTKETVYRRVTSRIIDQMERGVVPWVRPWTTPLPFNVVSSRPYRGINILTTWAHQLECAYECNGYLTFLQAKQLGGWIKRGERGVPILLYREASDTHDDEEHEATPPRKLFMPKAFTVFNLEQVGGLDRLKAIATQQRPTFEPLAECERVVAGTGAVIHENGDRASYSPARDVITMPSRSAFRKASDWYATVYHELGHWTGARHRLARDLSGNFGSTTYAQEELTAELAAAFLSARTGIEHASQSASYLSHWLQVLRNDRRFIFVAAKQATQIAAFIYPDGSPDPVDEPVS